jgi:hypothetical protein
MLALVESTVRIIVTGLPQELDKLVESFRFRPEGYFHADSYQVYRMTQGERGWDGYNYPFHRRDENTGEILRGRRDELLQKCKLLGFKVDTRRLLPRPYAHLKVEDIPDDLIKSSFKLDHGQKQAVADWLAHGIGISRMAVNSGKTATFAAAAAYIKRLYPNARFLYFTQTERLVRQVYDSMRQFLPDWDITQYGGGKQHKDGKDMVVATIAILGRHFKVLKDTGWFKTFMGVLIDESHHSQSATCERVLRSMAAYFRMAASDSMKEGDAAKHNKILGLCGPVRNEVRQITLITEGRSAAPMIYLVDVPAWKDRFRHLGKEAEPLSDAWFYLNGKWYRGKYVGPCIRIGRRRPDSYEDPDSARRQFRICKSGCAYHCPGDAFAAGQRQRC